MPSLATPDRQHRERHAAPFAHLLRPFAGAKLNRARDADGYCLPRLSAVDILTDGVARYDADIRAVTVEGIGVFFYSGCELIPWSDVRRVTIAALDEMGDRVGERVFYAADALGAAMAEAAE